MARPRTTPWRSRRSSTARRARSRWNAKWAEAEAAYQAAWDLRKSFDIAGNLGDCELHVGQPREAARHIAYSLAHAPAGATQQQKDALGQRLQEARRQVGTLHVRTIPSGAAVLVDGRPVEDLPDGLVFVDPGSRTVEARLQGYGTARKTLDAQAGSEQDVELTLVPAQSPPPPPPASWRPGTAWVITGGVLAGVGLATGLGLTFAGASKASDANADLAQVQKEGGQFVCSLSGNLASSCAALRSANKTADTLSNAAGAGYAVAGIGGAFLLTYFIWPGKKLAPTTGVRNLANRGQRCRRRRARRDLLSHESRELRLQEGQRHASEHVVGGVHRAPRGLARDPLGRVQQPGGQLRAQRREARR